MKLTAFFHKEKLAEDNKQKRPRIEAAKLTVLTIYH
jgi:hypothetical protein